MNLLDYQKSGKAFGKTVTPFEPFNPLKGLIPKVPGIKDILTFNFDFLSYLERAKRDPFYIQSVFGYRYDLVTSNGVARFNADSSDQELNKVKTTYDGFRQSIGSIPKAPANLSQNEELPNLYYGAPYSYYESGKYLDPELGTVQDVGLTGNPKYIPKLNYSLGNFYRTHTKFNNFRFSGYPNESPEIKDSSIITDTVVSTGDPELVTIEDTVGQNYTVFNFRREQYIYMFGTIPFPASLTPAKLSNGNITFVDAFDLSAGNEVNDYQYYANFVKLNFLSFFHTMNKKDSSFAFPLQGIGNFPAGSHGVVNFLNINPASPQSVKFDSTIFNGESIGSPSIESAPSGFFETLLSTPNPKSSTDVDGGIVNTYDADFMELQSNTIKRIAHETFKSMEAKTYTDIAFDVEPDVVGTKKLPIFGLKGNEIIGYNEGANFTITSFPGGVPIDVEKATVGPISSEIIATKGKILSANVKTVYNYLNTGWENVLQEIPELAIPTIFHSDDFNFPTQDALLKGVKDTFFGELVQQYKNCKTYKEINDFATQRGFGKKSKIIFVRNEKYLADSEDAKDNFPMYNEISFDIYSNANRRLSDKFRYSGLLTTLMQVLFTHKYAPVSKIEYEADITKADFEQTSPENGYSLVLEFLYKIKKAEETGMFKGSEEDQSIIFKTLELLNSGIFENFFSDDKTGGAKKLSMLDIEKVFQYYLLAYEALSQGIPAEEVDFILENNQEYTAFSSYVGPPDSKQSSSYSGTQSFLSYAEGFQMLNHLKSNIKDLLPKINEILSLAPRYSEPFGYIIEKYDNADNCIQRIFMPHFGDDLDDITSNETKAPNVKTIKYIDTQVKYGRIYKYKIKQLRMVVGADYRYVFSSNTETHRRAMALGYPMQYDTDVITKTLRQGNTEGKILADAANLSDLQTNAILGLNPASSYFTFYTQPRGGSTYNQYEDYELIDIGDYTNYYTGLQDMGPDLKKADENEDFSIFEKLAIFKSMVYPNLKLVEVPYFEDIILVSDFPPIPPNVNFDPLVGKGSTILMTFENQTGDREEVPIIIDQIPDEQLFGYQRIAQERHEASFTDSGTYKIPQIRFKSDDFPQAYQIFVTDQAPAGYESFAGKMALELNVEDATAIQQSLAPNKKYYFVFRTVDIHGNISNPSPVYQVEMVFNSGVYYPIVEIYEFPTKTLGNKSKSFKQYAKIEASLIQRVVNREKSLISDATSVLPNGVEPVLGVAPESLWDQKKFKFRIISKHTGKAIDMNIKFKTNYTEPEKPIKGC